MPQSVTQLFNLDKDRFEALGAFDAILDIDTRLFIDPKLLRVTTVPEFKNAIAKVEERFVEILDLLAASNAKDDKLWREADKRMSFPEVEGICIGYSSKGTGGSGIGPEIRARLLDSAQQIVKAGLKNPAIFELAGLFEDGVGPDRISDMIARILSNELKAYTERVLVEMRVMTARTKAEHPIDLPLNPFNGKQIVLVPKELLRDLPLALDWGDVHKVAAHNAKLREEFNDLIGNTWGKAARRVAKKDLKDALLKHPELLLDLLEQYLGRKAELYDFKDDPAGQVIWHEAAQAAAEMFPLELKLGAAPTIEELEELVLQICEHFRVLVEQNRWWKLLYDKHGKPKHEEAAQLLFYGVADIYCAANNIDVSREADGGRGPVDFKFSKGYDLRVVVEAKLTSNKALTTGYKHQLPAYALAEKAKRGIYVVIDNGASPKKMKTFEQMVKEAAPSHLRVFNVDGTPRKSASKLK